MRGETTQKHEGETGGVSPAADGPAYLHVLASPDETQVGRSLPIDGALVIGRRGHPQVSLEIEDRKLSRSHAVVRARGDGLGAELQDEGSTNGSFVNGERKTTARLDLGGVLRVGDTLIEVV